MARKITPKTRTRVAGRKAKTEAKPPAYTSRRAWKLIGSRRWPPPDNPMLRHEGTEADWVIVPAAQGGATALAQLRSGAASQARAMAASASGPVPPQAGGSNWTQLGPFAIPNGQTYTSARVLVSGRVTAIAINPLAPDTMFLGSALGGIWRTTDGGSSWEPRTDDEVSLATGAIALDPNFPQVVYVGTGEGNFSLDSYYGLGVLKSVDGGDTWTNLARATFLGQRFNRLLVTPSTGAPATQLFAAASRGLYRSNDGGVTWTALTSGLPSGVPATDVVMDPLTPNTIYVAFWNRGIYKSTNADAPAPTFTQLTSGLPVATAAAPSGVFRIALGISSSSPQTVYALMSNNDTTAASGYTIDKLYFTTNGGAAWAQIALPGGSIGRQGFYNLAVAVDPTTPDIVYLSATSLWKAVYSGGTWTISDIGGGFHPDNHVLAFRPGDHMTLYAGSDGGVYRSTNGGAVWDDAINKGLCIAQFEFIDQHPASTAVVFGGTQDNGTEQYRGSEVFNHADEGDGGFVIVNQSDATNVLSTYYGPSPKLSTQGGKFGTWTDVSGGIGGTAALFYPPFAACRTDPVRVAMGTSLVNIDTAQGTGGWPTKVTLPGLAAGERLSALCFVDPNLIYAGTETGKVYKLVGPAWTATLVSQAPLPTSYIWDVSPLPTASDTVVVVMSGFGISHVWQGAIPASGPAAWTNISGAGAGVLPDIPVNALVIDPLNGARMFIGTDVGVFETQDGGATWSSISGSTSVSTGLPNCAVFDLRLHDATRMLRAATHGRGLWEKPADAPSTPTVDIYVRDHVMDTARTTTTQNVPASFEDPLRNVALGDPQWWWMCADIKVDALEGTVPAFQTPVSDVDYLFFEAKLQHRQAQRTRVNRVYVQVHNRGFQPAPNVSVKILWAEAGAGLPNLPNDFWTAFPGDSTDTTAWHPVGAAQTIASLKPGPPTVLEWDWIPPASAAEHSCMLVVMDCASDPIPTTNKVFDIGALVPREKRVGLKNLHLINPPPAVGLSAILQFKSASRNTQIVQTIPHGAGLKASLIFSKHAIPANTKFAGMRARAPSQPLLKSLTQKYGDRTMATFDTTKVYSLSSVDKPGQLSAVFGGQETKAIVVIEGAAKRRGGAVLSIVQHEGAKLVGGSTFAIK